MNEKHKSYRETIREFADGNAPHLVKNLKDKISKQKVEKGSLDWKESIHIASYATVYATDDLLTVSENLYKSGKRLECLTIALVVLTGVLVFAMFIGFKG